MQHCQEYMHRPSGDNDLKGVTGVPDARAGSEEFINQSIINSSWFMAHGSRPMAHASRLVAQGPWLMAKKNLALGPPGPGP